jgi:membrane protein YqaA with SNARE-associated domain
MHHYIEVIGVFALRYGVVFARPAFHHFFHKAAEHGIHMASHRVGILKILTSWFKFLPDAVMIAILLLLDVVIESFGGVPAHGE